MTLDALRALLTQSPLVASVQASEGAAVDDPAVLARMARDHVSQGVRLLRLQGIENIRAVRAVCPGVPIIGLIKVRYPRSSLLITPTMAEVDALLEAGCEIVALDATNRKRPGGVKLGELIERIHAGGALAMADCDTMQNIERAITKGADIIGTTLAGYTPDSLSSGLEAALYAGSDFADRVLSGGNWESVPAGPGPDFVVVDWGRRMIELRPEVLLLAEGRYSQRWQVEAALQAGADGVVVGGALNDPTKQTRALTPRREADDRMSAFDLGGTWLRFGCIEAGELVVERIATPPTREERLAWMRDRIEAHGLVRAAVSTGGTVDPRTGEVWESKPMIPEHLGTIFSEATLGVPTVALNDGLATALAHARVPEWVGKRVATLALGTGVGAGFVAEGKLLAGRRGEYPRYNDLPLSGGGTVEEALGGAALTPSPSEEARARAVEAFRLVDRIVRETMFPDVVVVGGAVGLSEWLRPELRQGRGPAIPSPFGTDAGLHGALSLARWGL